MRVAFLPDVLRAAGLTVIELDGWRGRGRNMNSVEGVVWHDTVTPPRDPSIDARLLRDGHASLRGPLSQLGVDRLGRYWMIADGRCNHNGFGEWGNDSIGIEVFCGGGGVPGRIPIEPYNSAQREAVVVGTAAINRHLRLTVARNKGHRETDPRRKIDPFMVDTDELRRRVRTANIGNTSIQQEDDVAVIAWAGPHAYHKSGVHAVHILGEALAQLREFGLKEERWPSEQAFLDAHLVSGGDYGPDPSPNKAAM